MPPRPLPNNPSLARLRKIAKELRSSVDAGAAEARALVEEFHPRADALARFSLADAQLVTARSHGFASWTKLKQHLVEIAPLVWNAPRPPDAQSRVDVFLRLACLSYTAMHPSPSRASRMLADDPGLAQVNVYTASASGDVVSVRAMLDRDPSLLNAKGGPLQWAPLLYACYSRVEPSDAMHSTLEVARLLLARGADPNAGFLYDGSYAFTALTGAFGRGEDWPNQPPHPECEALARLLLEHGADPNDAQTLYNRHFKPDNTHFELLFTYGLGDDKGGPWIRRLNDPLFNPKTLLVVELCAAAQHAFFDRVKLLVEHGVEVNGRSRRTGRTPYEEAIRAGHIAIAEYLLQHGAAKHDPDPLEAFAMACIAGDRLEADARLAADPTLLDGLGQHRRVEMLHRAMESGHMEGLRLIVELGVDINAMVPGTGMDRTVLHNAAGWGSLEIVQLLVELGADPNLRDLTYHATPIAWALYNGGQRQRAVIEYLLPLTTIFDAVQAGAVERVAALLRDDPGLVHARDDRGVPLVFRIHPGIARLGDMLDVLVAQGADLNVRDDEGKTLVDRALARGLTELADTLRAHGAVASGSA